MRHRRYGIPWFSPAPARYTLRDGLSIAELPLSTLRLLGSNVPVAGGGYFRLLPWTLLRRAVRGATAALPMTTYFHPYEFDPQRLDVFTSFRPANLGERVAGLRWNFHQNLGRRTIPAKLERVLMQAPFATCRRYLDETQLGAGRELFPAAR